MAAEGNLDEMTQTPGGNLDEKTQTGGNSDEATHTQGGNLDEIFDFFIPTLNKLIIKEGFDPLKSAESPEITFEKLGISGGAEAEAPTLYGLSHLKRTGPADIDGLTVTANFGVDGDIKETSGAKAWLGPISVGPEITFTVSDISIRVVMTLERDETGKAKIDLDSLDAADPDISVEIDGLGELGWIAGEFTGAISTVILKLFKSEFLTMLEGILRKELKKLNLPI